MKENRNRETKKEIKKTFSTEKLRDQQEKKGRKREKQIEKKEDKRKKEDN